MGVIVPRGAAASFPELVDHLGHNEGRGCKTIHNGLALIAVNALWGDSAEKRMSDPLAENHITRCDC